MKENEIFRAEILLLLALALASSIPSYANASVNNSSNYPFRHAGINVDNPLTEAEAMLAKKAGVSWIRADVNFFKRDYQFSRTYIVATKIGLSIIGILDYATIGYSKTFTLDDWRAAVVKAQTVYPKIHVWEIWNEPTGPKYKYGYQDGTPQHYFNMLKAAYKILKTGDRNSIVLGIGGAQLGIPKDLPFTESVFKLGGAAFMDALAIHAYPYRLNVGSSWDSYEQLWTRELQQYRLFGKQLWLTETGLRSDQLTESEQATYLNESYSFFRQMHFEGYYWYVLIDNQQSGPYGIFRADLTAKPIYHLYSRLLSV